MAEKDLDFPQVVDPAHSGQPVRSVSATRVFGQGCLTSTPRLPTPRVAACGSMAAAAVGDALVESEPDL